MKCEEVENLIVDYIDEKLDKAKVAEIEKHLTGCEYCLDMFKDTQNILLLMAEKKTHKPDDSMRINFYHMLHKEISAQKQADPVTISGNRSSLFFRTAYGVAAGIALLTGGIILGLIFSNGITGKHKSDEISRLTNEVNELRKTAMYSLLKDESSSSRIQAVNFISEIPEPDLRMVNALIHTLNNDENVNVRLTAAFALSKYGSVQAVRDSLVSSLTRQSDPILQVNLINILVDLKEKKAFLPIQEIMSDEKTMDVVKSVAQSGIRMLI